MLFRSVRRNGKRFPPDFMFQLTKDEAESLLLQTARAKTGRGGRQTPPYAFTEHGVAMLSSVLNSERAVQMNILIIRAFVRLRELMATHKDLARKIDQLEASQKQHSRTRAAAHHPPGSRGQGHPEIKVPATMKNLIQGSTARCATGLPGLMTIWRRKDWSAWRSQPAISNLRI